MSQMILIPCQQCGYESPDNARFCRSCGAALAPENELSASATRNYGRQEAAPAAVQSAPLNPSVVDAFGDPTRRQYAPPPQPAPASNTNPFYSAPPAPQYGYAPPQPARKKLRWLKWAGAVALLGCAFGIGTEVGNNPNNARLDDAEFKLIENARREGRIEERLFRISTEVGENVERKTDELLRQLDRASEEARRAAEKGIKAESLNVPLLDLTKYEYAEATVSNAIRIAGKELTKQHVKSDFATLVRHYEGLLGKPIVLKDGDEDREKRALFQSVSSPEQVSVTVFIKESDEYDEQWEVQIMRSPFKFPRPNNAQPVTAAVAPKIEMVEPPPPPPPPALVEKISPPKPDAKSPKN